MRTGQAEDSGKYPCGMCRQGVGDNPIKCVACHRWVHKGVVVSQVDWGMLLISAAGGVWMVTLLT